MSLLFAPIFLRRTHVKLEEEINLSQFGLMNNAVWYEYPKKLLFTAARYKFVAKVLSGYNNVVEVGCGDGFCSRIVKQEVQRLTITDIDPLFIERFADIQSGGLLLQRFMIFFKAQ
ncbi:hypothetical protein MAL08_11280 [Leptospira noguchii]|nr:hypothetical protein [Leptospira noguchii]UOG36699.1 hypothetical protein MAL08_11280 [Leptospira noguchii]